MARLRELTWPEAGEALSGRVALLPVGSVEQHGRHMPLATDHVTAERIALGAEARHDLVILPTLPYGISPHHRQFFGTLTLRSELFREVVLDIARSLKSHGVEKMIAVNGHGGNSGVLAEAAMNLRQEGMACAVYDWWRGLEEGLLTKLLGEKGASIIGHACAMETSVGLHLFPEWMKPEAAVDVPASWARPIHGGQVYFDTLDFTPHGNIGYPTLARPEAGATLIEHAVANLVELVRWMEAHPLADLLARPHL